MSYFQRIKSVFSGVFMILFALLLLFAPKQSYPLIAIIVSMLVFVYGFKLLIYYFRMARYMVGGKAALCQAIIILDAALFISTMVFMGDLFIMIYLLGIYAFTGFVDILRAIESMSMKSKNWKLKFFTGLLSVLFAVTLVIVGAINGNLEIVVYGFCFSLFYSAAVRIATAFKRTAIVYIQ
ncbi:MAG: DUF308 domain-containing protein [Ruminococcus sp.]|nr:DUF308 domain-containing protein [Ruminococcus sp.]